MRRCGIRPLASDSRPGEKGKGERLGAGGDRKSCAAARRARAIAADAHSRCGIRCGQSGKPRRRSMNVSTVPAQASATGETRSSRAWWDSTQIWAGLSIVSMWVAVLFVGVSAGPDLHVEQRLGEHHGDDHPLGHPGCDLRTPCHDRHHARYVPSQCVAHSQGATRRRRTSALRSIRSRRFGTHGSWPRGRYLSTTIPRGATVGSRVSLTKALAGTVSRGVESAASCGKDRSDRGSRAR